MRSPKKKKKGKKKEKKIEARVICNAPQNQK